jgi:hypothetical protein
MAAIGWPSVGSPNSHHRAESVPADIGACSSSGSAVYSSVPKPGVADRDGAELARSVGERRPLGRRPAAVFAGPCSVACWRAKSARSRRAAALAQVLPGGGRTRPSASLLARDVRRPIVASWQARRPCVAARRRWGTSRESIGGIAVVQAVVAACQVAADASYWPMAGAVSCRVR